MEKRRAREDQAASAGDPSAKRIDDARRAQPLIMDLAAILPAQSCNDVLYKLALWRWDTPGIDAAGDDMPPNVRIAYYAFRDLVALTGDASVRTDDDLGHNARRPPPAEVTEHV